MIARIVTSIRRNAIAWLALFVALTGTSMAATHYVVTSTKQIKPAVLKKLTGKRGLIGPTGATGPQGSLGKEGSIGPGGPAGPKGTTGTTGTKGEKGVAGEVGPTGPGVGSTGPTGPTGASGEKGTTGSAGGTGPTGATGSGGAKAWAHISASGAITLSEGFGTAKVTADPINKTTKKAEPGMYCITGLSFEPENVQATLDGEETSFAMPPLVHIGHTADRPAPKKPT